MNTMSRGYPAGSIRVSDADRDAVLAELSEHLQAGRLTSAEFDERTSKALAARTGADLAALTVDLPALPATVAGVQANSDADADLARYWSFGRVAIAVAVIGLFVSISTSRGHVRVDMFPWWLIPLGFFACRRLACGRNRERDDKS